MLKGKLRFLFLGDSYTAGTAVPENLRWPVQLTERIRQSGVDADPPRFIAGNGWTTKDLMDALDAEKPAPEFASVFLLIGVNNQFQGRPLAEFEMEFDLLVGRAIQLAMGRNGRVFVLAVPDYSVTPFAADRNPARISSEIDLFNKVCVKIAAQHQVEFLDTVDISRQAGTNGALLVEDGLHPSEEMYRLWSNFVFTKISGRV